MEHFKPPSFKVVIIEHIKLGLVVKHTKLELIVKRIKLGLIRKLVGIKDCKRHSKAFEYFGRLAIKLIKCKLIMGKFKA